MNDVIVGALTILTLLGIPLAVVFASYDPPRYLAPRPSWEQEVAMAMRRISAIRQQTIRRMDEAEPFMRHD